ncbi:MAG: hypothetical protein K0S21_2118 [Rhizobiaceae bacterium]|jgi:predicted protein tyrosine phosphatase|nr:hypothetical protein [Rhizobiaceae bacterium]
MIHVCPLSRVDTTVAACGAGRLVSLLATGTAVLRPPAIAEQDHLWLSLHDIAEARDGMILPGELHVRKLLDFARSWDLAKPMVIHCYAGISRSTASAYIVAAALAPDRDEFELAGTLRRLSPTATPNPLLIELADGLLGRQGRMVDAVRQIGRGTEAFEGEPFMLGIEP